MKKLTVEEFTKLPEGEVFRSGVIPNSPEGLFMTRDGGSLRWIAKKGYGNDWAVYCHWDYHDEEWIAEQGDKVSGKDNIQKCVPCTDEVLKLYRY